MPERIETLIVGGGQAGLATSYHLTRRGREHVVLEQAPEAGNAWRTGRWDSFYLNSPNWTLRMPGAEYDGSDRDGFMPLDQIVAYFEQYVARHDLPLRYNTHVVSVEPMDGSGYRIQTTDQAFEARNVVMATGYEQLPRIPAAASALSPDITQLHSSSYRNPESLPAGRVLVVGSAQSGCQIAEELNEADREVFLCTGGAGRAPRRYRGRDIIEWLEIIGFFDLPVDQLPGPREHFAPPQLTGTKGGHTINLHQFARDGMRLLGHFRGAAGDIVSIVPDLHENLARADAFERRVLKMIDEYVISHELEVEEEELPQMGDGFEQPDVEELDLKAAGVHSVIWASGYRRDFSLIKLPVLDEQGYLPRTRGTTDYPGLYFVGMAGMPSIKPSILAGVSESAQYIVDTIAGANEDLLQSPRTA